MSNQLLALLLTFFCASWLEAQEADNENSNLWVIQIEVVSSKHLQIIDIARNELYRLRPTWKAIEYNISLVETDYTYEVAFWQSEDERIINFETVPGEILGTGWKTAPGGLNVTIDKAKLTIIKSNTLRH